MGGRGMAAGVAVVSFVAFVIATWALGRRWGGVPRRPGACTRAGALLGALTAAALVAWRVHLGAAGGEAAFWLAYFTLLPTADRAGYLGPGVTAGRRWYVLLTLVPLAHGALVGALLDGWRAAVRYGSARHPPAA